MAPEEQHPRSCQRLTQPPREAVQLGDPLDSARPHRGARRPWPRGKHRGTHASLPLAVQ